MKNKLLYIPKSSNDWFERWSKLKEKWSMKKFIIKKRKYYEGDIEKKID